MPRAINDAGLALIKQFEGLRLQPYDDIAGKSTIGYGHLIKDGEDYSAGITEDEATTLLESDLNDAEDSVQSHIYADINDNQYSALVSLVYNVGTKPLTGTIGELINAGNAEEAVRHFILWDNAGGVPSEGLKRRRIAEAALFVTPV